MSSLDFLHEKIEKLAYRSKHTVRTLSMLPCGNILHPTVYQGMHILLQSACLILLFIVFF